MVDVPRVSIIIATYNSDRTLPLVLTSIRKQTYPSDRIEVLVVDGGSTDKTIRIAKSFGFSILNNPNVVPAWAKYIGYRKAHGKYIMFLDSDEELVRRDSLERKVKAFKESSSVRAVTGSGYRNPGNYPFINEYVNEFGDPFSFFIYRLSKDERFFIQSMKAHYRISAENKDHVVFSFTHVSRLPIFELVAMGSVVDRKYLNKQFPEILKKPSLIPHLFYLIVSRGALVAIIKNDPLLHYSAISWYGYLRKIRSRVVNNVFTSAKEGFRGRDEISNGNVTKKYLFFPYAFTLVLPLMDALYLSITRRHVGYLLHVPLTLYTGILILYYTGIRAIGVRYNTNTYG